KSSKAAQSSPAASLEKKQTEKSKPAPQPERTFTRTVEGPEAAAVRKITAAIKDSLDLGPTLAVWIVDRTPSRQHLVSRAADAIQAFYDSPEIKEASAAEGSPLLSAVVAFDDQVQFVVDPPSSDAQAVKAGLDSIKPSMSGREMTFTAIK